LRVVRNPQYGEALQELAASARSELALVSAFATTSGVESLLAAASSLLRRKEIHVRWQVEDLVCGASDLAVYELAKEKGFAVFMQPALHAKFVLADRARLILGSANFTGRGLGLIPQTNTEAGIVTTVDSGGLREVESILAHSVLVTPDLYDRIRAFVDRTKSPTPRSLPYPTDVQEIIGKRFTGLWVRDLPFEFVPPSLTRGSSVESDVELEEGFAGSKCVSWLRSLVHSSNAEIYFGELTSSLHDTLLEDPLPYRTEVKKLAANLINWCTQLLPTEFGSDTPNYSQRIYRH
jgi:hypothetical protein